MNNLGITAYNPILRSIKVIEAASEVRRYIKSKGGLSAISAEDLRAIESTAISRDPEVLHAAREILMILTDPSRRDEIRINDTHYRLHHRLPWEVEYGPDKCPICGCEISDTGYCCCSGSVD